MTTDKSQIPYLLKLIDDPSPNVRNKVAEKLRLIGSTVWREMEEQQLSLTDAQKMLLDDILRAYDNSTLTIAWRGWRNLAGETEKLEEAYALLADWQLGRGSGARMRNRIQGLASEFSAAGFVPHPKSLCHFLFNEKNLAGAVSEDYYNPLNSNILYSLETGFGIPITLASIFILVGSRLGLTIHGCNFPGHFLARAHDGRRDFIFDCFDGGRLLTGSEMFLMRKAAPNEVHKPATAVEMIARVLRNLACAYYHDGDSEKARYMLSLRSDLELIERP